MSNLTTRAGKGSPLTNNELDANFTNLNADKVEIGGDLSGTPTAPIVTKVQGQSFSSAAANVGEKLVWNGTAWAPATDPSGEPIGHADKSESSIGFNAGTRTFTISPVSASFVVWCKGVKHTYTSAQTVVIPNTTGLHFIYFNASGVLSTQMTYFTWEEHAPTAYIYWNATTQQAVYFGDERHGITLDWQTHEYLHRTRGAAIANGFGASGYTTTGTGATDADAQIDIGGGTFFDEDMQVDIVSTNTPVAGTWQQDLSGPALIPVLYLSGSSWVLDSPTNFPFKVVSGVPQYNLYSGGTWSTAPVSNNEYFVSWILATNNLTYPVIAIISQAPTNQLSGAEAMTFEGLNLNGFPSVEFRPLYKVIYQYKTGFTNSIKASTISVYDLRSLQSAGVAAALVQDHGNLSGLGDDDHAQYLHVSEVRTPSSAVKNSFLPSQTSNNGKYLTTDGINPSWGDVPSGSLTFTGDVTGTGNTGSSTTLTLANSGVTAGTFTKVTVDTKGRVTTGASANSSDIATALGFTPENVANKAVANGYASLDGSGKVPSNQLPSYVDDVLEYANLAAFPATGETGKIYIAIDTVKTYRWSGSAYVEITSSPGSTDAVPEGSTNLYFTNARARAAVGASGSLSYSTATGIFSYTQPTNVSAFTNDSGYLTGITGAQVTSALGYTPYNATNPAGYTTNVGTVYSVSGTGTVSGLTLTGSVTSSGSLTLGGTLSLTSGQVTTALGYTPYNATNPSGYITGITSGMVTTALGYTPYNSSNPSGYITSSSSITGNAATVSSITGNTGLMVDRLTPSSIIDGLTTSNFRSTLFGTTTNAAAISAARWNTPPSALSGIGYYGTMIAWAAADTQGFLALDYNSANAKIGGGNGNNINWSATLLHSSNYGDYAPSKAGTGASGTWGIRITGFANQGTARLYSTDAAYNYDSGAPYYGYLTYDGSRWLFQVSPGTPAAVRVAYADAAGSATDSTKLPLSGGTLTGGLNVGTAIGSRATSLSVSGSTNSSAIAAKSSDYATVFGVLPHSGSYTYFSTGVYYQSGSWVHASSNDNSALFSISGNLGAQWWASSNSSASWNLASGASLWNVSGTWIGALNAASGAQVNGSNIWHAGNFTPGNYLALSGGTLSGAIRAPQITAGGSNNTDANFGVQGTSHLTGTVYWGGTVGNVNSWSSLQSSSGGNHALSVNTFVVNRSGYGGISGTYPGEILRVNEYGYAIAGGRFLADSWVQSDRDFPNGTLITTDINYAVTNGDPFILEIRGNTYGNIVPLDIQYQGYIYYDTIINHGGISNGLNISGLVAINNGGNLCFWFPSQGYWNGYYVRAYVPYATYPRNRVTSITHVGKPTTAKQVDLSANIRQSFHSGNVSFTTAPNSSWGGRVRIGGNGGTDGVAAIATVQATDGNLHLDSGSGKSTYINYYNNGPIYLNGGSYSISSNGSYYNGAAASATNATNATNATYGRYVYDDGAYSGSAAYREASSMHVYYSYLGRLVYNNGAHSGSGWVEASDLGVRYASRSQRANGNFYIDDNYGNGIVGLYSADRYQGVFAMGDSYKLPANGTTTGNLYGIAWSHPNAGGVAGNLDSHGMLVLINGGFGSCMAYSIKASGNVTAYSDERLKTNWREMPENYVERLAQVKVGIYDRIDGEKITQVGIGAQSFQRLLPEAITKATDEMGTLSVSYGNAAMASAVELAKELVMLKKELAEIKSRLH